MIKSFLDKVKTTVPVSMKTKNDLKQLKGSMSYEEYIRMLIRQQHTSLPIKNGIINTTFERKEALIQIEDFSIIFAYNSYSDVPNFRFDMEIKDIRKKGKKILFKTYAKRRDTFEDYFKLLELAIQKEIEPLFAFKKYGREDYKDYASWKRHFTQLSLSDTAYSEDVLEVLERLHENESPYA
jgi:hypothetical protein